MISARRAKHLDSTHVYILSCKHISRPIRACRRVLSWLLINVVISSAVVFRTCLHGGGGPQIGEVTCGGSPHLSCKRDQIKMRDYVDRTVAHQSGLPHLLGVPHLHVNRPYISSIFFYFVPLFVNVNWVTQCIRKCTKLNFFSKNAALLWGRRLKP